ncbi:hypothetical protein AB595_14875 [Massilia sp. WF1]|nr:hypothetical protein AB595_14875 [Massilia sp. WF1]
MDCSDIGISVGKEKRSGASRERRRRAARGGVRAGMGAGGRAARPRMRGGPAGAGGRCGRARSALMRCRDRMPASAATSRRAMPSSPSSTWGSVWCRAARMAAFSWRFSCTLSSSRCTRQASITTSSWCRWASTSATMSAYSRTKHSSGAPAQRARRLQSWRRAWRSAAL